jgi:hypothetical protein
MFNTLRLTCPPKPWRRQAIHTLRFTGIGEQLKGEGNGDFNIQKINGRIQIPRGFEYIKFDVD